MEQDILCTTIDEIVQGLSIENLIDVLEDYNYYVVTFFETHDEGSQPVGLLEFFNNDYFAK